MSQTVERITHHPHWLLHHWQHYLNLQLQTDCLEEWKWQHLQKEKLLQFCVEGVEDPKSPPGLAAKGFDTAVVLLVLNKPPLDEEVVALLLNNPPPVEANGLLAVEVLEPNKPPDDGLLPNKEVEEVEEEEEPNNPPAAPPVVPPVENKLFEDEGVANGFAGVLIVAVIVVTDDCNSFNNCSLLIVFN